MPNVKVTFQYFDAEGNPRPEGDDMRVPLSLDRSRLIDVVRDGVATIETDGPWASISTPFIGDLTEAEIARLSSRRTIHEGWYFTVDPVSGGGV